MINPALPLFRRIDRQCDAFERAWRQEMPPEIEQFIQGYGGQERVELLRELVGVDAEYRARGQDRIPDYLSRFPELGADAPRELGQYLLLERIGTGATGEVYRGVHRRMRRQVAVKVLRQGAAGMRSLFEREARAAGLLCHPNIVAAYDAGEEAGVPYLVTELIDGQDLAAIVGQHGPMPLDLAISCAIQAARGLEYAHERGLVHRDVKPGNLLMDQRGVVRVMDVGLARWTSEADGERRLVGTPAYMAPEQAEDAGQADARADVYGLGCTFYYLLTGQTLFPAESVAGQVAAHRKEELPRLPGELASVERAFQQMIAKRPQDLQQSMREVIQDLEAIGCGGRSCRRLVSALFTVLVVVAIWGATAVWRGSGVTPRRGLEVPMEVRHEDGMVFRLIPAGGCWIGTPGEQILRLQAGEPNAEVRRRLASEHLRWVQIPSPFYMGSTEVTIGQFRRFVEQSGYVTEAERNRWPAYGFKSGQWVREVGYSWRNVGQELRDDLPVANLTASDAAVYCAWLTASSKEGRRFRLPSEAEWEYACRGGSQTTWPGGNDPAELELSAWYEGNAGRVDNRVRPVGTRLANSFGLMDMLGNVEELCSGETSVVLKGGNISGGPAHVRPAARVETGVHSAEGGIRLVMQGR